MAVQPNINHSTRLSLEWVPPDKLKPYDGNARIHSDRQIKVIAESIQTNGFNNPILIDRDGVIIAGHGRLEAALKLGLSKVPTLRADHLTPEQVKAFRIADNRIAELADWDEDLLAIELQQITLDTPELIIGTGFSMAEIDLLIEAQASDGAVNDMDAADMVPAPTEDEPAISQPGDLWLLDDHRLYCGNALEAASYQALMGSDRARLVFADAPYNVRVKGHVSGKGAVQHREFSMASGEMDERAYTAFLTRTFTHLKAFSMDGSLHLMCMDWRHGWELRQAARTTGFDLKNLCVWVKKNGGMGSHYRSQHELIYLFKNGKSPHINNVELGRFGRNRTNVWNYAGVNSFGEGRDEALAMHPTVKPVALVKDAILDSSNRGDIVLDPFLGSGTTLIAAHESGRRSYGMEIDPLYVDTIIRRWESLTGQRAIHATSGQSFEETRRTRQSNAQGGDNDPA